LKEILFNPGIGLVLGVNNERLFPAVLHDYGIFNTLGITGKIEAFPVHNDDLISNRALKVKLLGDWYCGLLH